MDRDSQHARLTTLHADLKDILQRLQAHEAKLMTHHPSPERDHALNHAKGSIRRQQKALRRVERALKVER
jgi:hypothetical protein